MAETSGCCFNRACTYFVRDGCCFPFSLMRRKAKAWLTSSSLADQFISACRLPSLEVPPSLFRLRELWTVFGGDRLSSAQRHSTSSSDPPSFVSSLSPTCSMRSIAFPFDRWVWLLGEPTIPGAKLISPVACFPWNADFILSKFAGIFFLNDLYLPPYLCTP